MSGFYFGQVPFGGYSSTPSLPASTEPTQTLVVHVDANVLATGTATQATAAVIASSNTDATIAWKPADAVIAWKATDARIAWKATDAVISPYSTDATDFDWLVSP